MLPSPRANDRPSPVDPQGSEDAYAAPTREEYRDKAAGLYPDPTVADAMAELLYELHAGLAGDVVEVFGDARAKHVREALRAEGRRLPLGQVVEALLRRPDLVVPAVAALLERVGQTVIPSEGRPSGDLLADSAETVSAAADVNAETIAAMRDQRIDEDELARMSARADALGRELADYREQLHQIKLASRRRGRR